MGPTHSDLQPVAEVAASWSGKAFAKVFLKCFVTKLNTLGRKGPETLANGSWGGNTECSVWLFQCFIARETWGFFPKPGIDQTD